MHLLILGLKLLPNVALCGGPNSRKLAAPCRESARGRSFSFRCELSTVDFEFSVSNNIRGKQRKMISLSEVTIHSTGYGQMNKQAGVVTLATWLSSKGAYYALLHIQ